MGREVRRVPRDWKHPKNDKGHYIPLHGRSYETAAADWDEEYAQWQKGMRRSYVKGEEWTAKEPEYYDMWFSEYTGHRPSPTNYMPDWPDAERTHYQMYENTSEGTPISPVMDDPKALARWLADNGASAFGSLTASYDHWLAMIDDGWAPSGIMMNGVMMSGVEGMTKVKGDGK